MTFRSIPRESIQSSVKWALGFAWVAGLMATCCSESAAAQTTTANGTNQTSQVLTVEGTVEVARMGSPQWTLAVTNQILSSGDRLRTGPRSRATVRLSDLSVLRVNETTVLEIRGPEGGQGSVLDVKSGSTYFFNRSKPAAWQFRTPLVSGAIRGTEFNLAVEDRDRTTITLLEGQVELRNASGELFLHSGEQGTIDPGQPPRKTAMLSAINIIQWSLYYPAVLDLRELNAGEAVQTKPGNSMAAYQSGDLLSALNGHPADPPGSDEERIYQAALLLAVGQVKQTEALLGSLHAPSPLATALRRLIASVKHEETTTGTTPVTASEWLAESYYLQSRSRLEAALGAARKAVEKSPEFGFAWIRLAELEFSRGRVDRAKIALEKGLAISTRNAQGLALRGFLFAAQNRITEALEFFNRAISVDGALANAWLGRGLCHIRQGHAVAGRLDLQVAATLEPNRSDLRSYLGKAWDQTGDGSHAAKELMLAKELDPSDPTPWLYSSLLAYNNNENNVAIADLEKSKELNDNRSVFRSRLLLDQDRAVRSANLATLYRDAGLVDVSVREAALAVDTDYANFSAHLFLANSYDALRDPSRVNLRYETPWLSQLLVANLLAPVGSLSLSQNVSQQDYTRLFDQDGVGLYSQTEYLSNGDWIENASEYGNVGNTGFALDQYFRSETGDRPNNDLRDMNFSGRIKQQISPADSLYFDVAYGNFRSGDVLQYYDPRAASQTLRIEETQDANIFAGYHREWNPGIHTLVLVGRLQDEFSQNDPSSVALVTTKSAATGQIIGVAQRPAVLSYSSELVAYTAEIQQIFQSASHTVVTGLRYQSGDIDTQSFMQRLQPVNQQISTDLTRASAYGYYTWRVIDPLQLTAGLTYDSLQYPENNEIAPLSPNEIRKDQWSPKVGLRWNPWEKGVFRGFWARSMGGVFYDTSVRLEPTEVAGFNQAFRSVLPESVAGLVPGSKFDSTGLAFEQEFSTRTYLSLVGEILKSEGVRTVGTLDAFGPLLLDQPSGVEQRLDFEEKTVAVVLDQLIGNMFSVGGSFRVSQASLDDSVPAISPALSSAFSLSANRTVHATLQQLNLHALFNHPSGFFARGETIWTKQSNEGYAVDLPGDNFWHFNISAGYRFPRRRAEIQVALLNIGNVDYQLNPLNLHADLPRSRTFAASLKFNF